MIKKEISFEESLAEIENIVNKLENGNISLEDSLELFEKGIKLVKECEKKLKDAQFRVEILIKENELDQ